ncbi:FAD binding domain-containing protein [Suillus subluteus]|nr:FAD binding domain-containing protein [Suillus subluteus]
MTAPVLNVLIVDQRASKVTAGQGDGISPRTTEVLQAFYNPSSTGGIEVPLSVRYPFELALHQGAIQDIFLDSMKLLGVELSKDENELTDPMSYPVRVVLQRLDKSKDEPQEEIVHAKFVVGGDGAHSWIRKQFDVTMDGEQSGDWGVMDMAAPDTDFLDIRTKTLIRSNHGSVFVIPREQDRMRIYVQLEDKDFINPVTGRADKEKVVINILLRLPKNRLNLTSFIWKSEFLWWTIYSVFIAGDACHTHSPKAGQGMNAAINDSHNLAWKIALVAWWYESECRKFALDLIAWDKMWSTLCCGKPLTEQNSDGVSPEHILKTFQTDFTSGVGIHYQRSIAVNDRNQELANGLVLGKCVPPCKFMRAADAWPFELQDLLPSDFLFKLLVFTGEFSDLLQQARVESMVMDMKKPESFLKRRKETFNFLWLPTLLHSHWSKVFINDTDPTGSFGGEGYSYYGVGPEGALVAVRPDGYVGAIAPLDHVGGLDAYFASFMKIPAQA